MEARAAVREARAVRAAAMEAVATAVGREEVVKAEETEVLLENA